MAPSRRRKALIATGAVVLIAIVAIGGFVLVESSSRKVVTLYGDSLSVESGPYLERALESAGNVEVTNRALSGTSPCDWQPLITADLENADPDLVVVEVYGNNASACQRLPDGTRTQTDSPAYWRKYRRDLIDLVDRFKPSTKVILSAAPAARADRDSGRSHKAQMLALMNEVAIGRPNVRVVDAGAAVEEPKGHYTRVMKCVRGSSCPDKPTYGRAVVRSLDGLHFCPRIVFATVQLLEDCPIVPYGAWLFGTAEAKAAGSALDLDVTAPRVARQRR